MQHSTKNTNKYTKMSYSINDPPMATAVAIRDDHSSTMVQNAAASSAPAILSDEKRSSDEKPPILDLIRDSRPLNDGQIQRLMEQGYTRGLSTSLNEMKEAFALRIWIVDNSGSMQKADGHRIIPTTNPNVVRMVECSRWEEIVECVEYHIEMAGLIGAPTRFRLLNHPGANVGPQQFSVAENNNNNDPGGDVRTALGIMRKTRPGGCTPLTNHIREIWEEVSRIGPELRRVGKKVVIVIATDGLPTDERGYGGPRHNEEFVECLRLLEGLPVWVVVRLCTDDDDVVTFYNELDNQLELSLEVLDDFSGEAIEVAGENPWLNYALPLHRLREMGHHDRIFDMLDERPLTKTEVRDFCKLLFGQDNFDGIPDPSLDWQGFVAEVERLLRRESPQYDPVKRRSNPWISIRELNRQHNNNMGGCSSCVIL